MSLASAPAFNLLLMHVLAFLIPRPSIVESLNLARGIGADYFVCAPTENRHGSGRRPCPCPTVAPAANCWRSPAFRLVSNQAFESSSAMTMHAAIPRGEIPAKRQGRRPLALTLFVHMHKGCTRGAHRTPPPAVLCSQGGLRDRGWPTGFGRLRGGFLICAKSQGSQVVKKIHLGVASSGYCPFPLHTSSILPLCQNCARSGYPPDKPGGLLVHGGSEGDLYTKSSAGVARYTCFRRRRCPPKSCG